MKSKKKPLLKFTPRDGGGYDVNAVRSGVYLGEVTPDYFGNGMMVSAPELREIAAFMERQKSKGR